MVDEPKPMSASKAILTKTLNNSWAVTILGGLVLAMLTPLVTGFANLTFSTRSWDVFGASNAAGTPGSYLSPDAVYKLPLNERFRVDGDFLLSVGRDNFKNPVAAITSDTGRAKTSRISASNSLSTESECDRVAVHLMRGPSESDTEFFIMYTSQRLDDEGCKGFWARLLGI